MRAIKLAAPGGLDNLKLVETEPVDPGPGEVRVRIHASSLNFHDYAVAIGMLPVDDGRIPMSDGVGVVEAVGEGVTEFAVGDRVMSLFFPFWQDGGPTFERIMGVPGDMEDGYAAETVTRPVGHFTPMPASYDFDQAATLPCAALTAWRALMVESKVKPGDTVVVQGTGGVSIFALQFAKAAGCKVIATSSSDEKLERVKALGADELINYKATPEWGQKVIELTGGTGADVVVEVGGSGTVPESIRAIAFGGHISMIGVLAGITGDVPTAQLFQKNAVIHGITVGSRQHQLDMVAAIDINGIQPEISHRFDLAEIGDAFRLQEANGHFGKICLTL